MTACGGQCDRRAPNRVIKDSVGLRKAKQCSERLQAPQGLCDSLINSLKLLTSQQKDGDSPYETSVAVLLEKSRQGIMDGLRKFIEVDHHEAVNVGGLRQGIQLARW